MTSGLCPVVVTGAGGFLGGNLVAALLREGRRVVGVTSRADDEAAYRARIGVGAGEGADAAGMGALRLIAPGQLVEEPDVLDGAVLLNCAFPRGGDGAAMASGLRYLADMFELAARRHPAAVVNISSQSVYDPQRDYAAVEDSPLRLDTKYAVAKYGVELLAESRFAGAAPYTNIRLASLIGPGFEPRVVNKMARRALAEGVIEAADNGSRFGYLDVRDAVCGIERLLASDPASWAAVYNLGIENTYSLTEIAQEVYAAVEAVGGCVRHFETRSVEGGAHSSWLDATLFCEAFGWQPAWTLASTTRSIVAEARE